jgi:hypothetical protein
VNVDNKPGTLFGFAIQVMPLKHRDSLDAINQDNFVVA